MYVTSPNDDDVQEPFHDDFCENILVEVRQKLVECISHGHYYRITFLRTSAGYVLNRGLYCVLGLRTDLCTVLVYCTGKYFLEGNTLIRRVEYGQQ